MKTYTLLFPAVFIWSLSSAVLRAQGTLTNGGFESAVVPTPPPNLPVFISLSNALPGWTGYLGTNQTTQAIYAGISAGSALITILDRQAGGNFSESNQVIADRFTATLDAGIVNPSSPNEMIVSAAIAQSSLVPVAAQSIRFSASGYVSDLLVTLSGQNIPFFPLATGSNYVTYGGDVSAFAGTVRELRFTEQPITSPFSKVLLDSIMFSNQRIPEPSALSFVALGAWILGWRLKRTHR